MIGIVVISRMLRSIRISFAKIVIFGSSIIFGGVAYLAANLAADLATDLAIVFNISGKGDDNPIGNVQLTNTKFDGAFKLYAVTEKPVDLGYDENGSLYFLSQTGEIVKSTFDLGNRRQLCKFFNVASQNFLEEAGCSAIAFHPDFANQHTRGYGKFFVSVAEKIGAGQSFEDVDIEHHQEVIYEFTSSDHYSNEFTGKRREVLRLSGLPNIKGSVITDLTFDHRGLLYIGVADSFETDKSKASDLESVYGKVLRIDPLFDVERNTPYRVPRSNPFYLVKNSLSELWSYGLRNPHTVTYDPFREWVCISDTGKDLLEEFNVSHFGAEFFGWNLSEGSYFYPPSQKHAVSEEITSPQIEYARGGSVGRNVGGMIYRGERFPFLDGKAIFADETGQLLVGEVTPNRNTRKLDVLKANGEIKGAVKSMKVGPSGELFVFCEDGKIFELEKARPMMRHYYTRRPMVAMVW
jgi:hypothetical protein